ncbi:FIST signal transduction protein [Planosporangium sp. 12N6]|uniref:FIST signal transduction protein n=1 Tax=Planosporangium spinosum TaxID=3402278 RepID=UPI003CEBF3D4
MDVTEEAAAPHDHPGTDRRWLSVGSSAATDPRAAAEAAVTAALTGADPKLLLVFCAARHDPRAVLAGVRSVAAGVPLIGGSASAVLGPDGPGRDEVVVVALGGPGFSVVTAAAGGADTRQREAGATAAVAAARVEDRPHRALVLLTDGLSGGQEEILAGVYSVVGASVPLVGGSCSPDVGGLRGPAPARLRTFQFHGAEVLTNAVVAAAIASDGPLGVGLRHGWRKVGEPMIVTKSSGGDVFTLDDRPALTAYLQRLDAPTEAYTDPAAFEAFAQCRPLGIRRRSGCEVRGVSSPALVREGWLHSSGEVPEGSLIWPMVGDEESVLAAAGDACADAVAALGGQPPLGLVAFDCESRARMLGPDGVRREFGRMTGQTGGAPVAGLYTWGEIGRPRGINGFHNQTLVVLAVG